MSLFSQENPVLGRNATVNGTRPILADEIVLFLTASSVSQVVFLNPIEINTGSPNSVTQYQFANVRVAFGTASSSGTLQIEHLTGTEASGSGTNLLASAVALSGTANTTVAVGPASSTAAILAAGDRLGIVIGGTMTSLANCTVIISLTRSN